VLVVGVGNDLRRDDGVGRTVVEAVERRLGGEVDTVVTHQLLPEILEEFPGRRTVIVVDAAVPRGDGDHVGVSRVPGGGRAARGTIAAGGGTGPTGAIGWYRTGPAGAGGTGPGHALDLAGLLALAGSARIGVPECWSVTVPAYDLGLGDGLSAGTFALVDEAVLAVVGLVRRAGPDGR